MPKHYLHCGYIALPLKLWQVMYLKTECDICAHRTCSSRPLCYALTSKCKSRPLCYTRTSECKTIKTELTFRSSGSPLNLLSMMVREWQVTMPTKNSSL